MSIAEEGTHPLMTIFLFFPFDYHTAKQYENHAPSTKPMHIGLKPMRGLKSHNE